MIFRLLLVCLLIGVLVILIQQFRRKSQHVKKLQTWQIALGIAALMLIILAVSGRIHWISALIATLFAFIRPIIPYTFKFFPAFRMLFKQYQQRKSQAHDHQNQRNNQQSNTHNSASITRKDALSILGLDETASRDEIITAHRRLMQKVHPDRGGNAELAARVNQAKDFLLG